MWTHARIRAAGPFLALAAAALGFVAVPRLPWAAAVAGAAFFAAAAAVRTAEATLQLRHARASADRLILAAHPERVVWRERELTAPRVRAALRAEIDGTLRTLSADRLPSASPLNRPAARRNAELLRMLVERLGDERPVSARGVLFVRGLLRDGASPLYSDRADLLLPRALSRALEELEP